MATRTSGGTPGSKRQSFLNHRLYVALGCFNFFRVLYFHIGKNLHDGAQKRIFLFPLNDFNAIGTLRDDVHRFAQALHSLNHRERAYLIEIRGAWHPEWY